MNTFGRIFRISIFGESHNHCIGVTVDGCPSGISLNPNDFSQDLSRRNLNIFGTTSRKEIDFPQIISGTFNEKTTGAPITIIFANSKQNSNDFQAEIVRPSHSDFVAKSKFNGFNDFRGSGMFSGRLTVGIVAAGVIAKKILAIKNEFISIEAKILAINEIQNSDFQEKKCYSSLKKHSKQNFAEKINSKIAKALETAELQGDSLGGIIECSIKNLPIGLGEPFFDSLESVISHIIFSIPGIRGIEFGAGFAITKMLGSKANDSFQTANGKTKTNNSGGINAGISNGNDLIFRVAIRPTPSIRKIQNTFNFTQNRLENLSIIGRNDICFALRTPVIIESAAAIALADMILLQ